MKSLNKDKKLKISSFIHAKMASVYTDFNSKSEAITKFLNQNPSFNFLTYASIIKNCKDDPESLNLLNKVFSPS